MHLIQHIENEHKSILQKTKTEEDTKQNIKRENKIWRIIPCQLTVRRKEKDSIGSERTNNS